MDKREVMKVVVEDLYATEKAVDDAIAQSTDFVATMIQARRDVNLSAVIGAEAQSKMLEAIAAMGQARDAVVAAHADLARVQRLIGLGHVAVGPVDKPEEDGPIHPEDDDSVGDGGGRGGVTNRVRRLRVAASA